MAETTRIACTGVWCSSLMNYLFRFLLLLSKERRAIMCAATKPNNISTQEEGALLKQRGNKSDMADRNPTTPGKGEPLNKGHGALTNSGSVNQKEERKKSVTFVDASALEKEPIQRPPTPFAYETPDTPTEFSFTKLDLNKQDLRPEHKT